MKFKILPILALAVALTGFTMPACSSAMAGTNPTEKIDIQTSANCGTCKATIEKALEETEGVKRAKLDLGNKVVTVKYDPDITDADKIRAAIAASGYDADDVKCDQEAHDALPACCQKGGHD